jgi:hypothetical protein
MFPVLIVAPMGDPAHRVLIKTIKSYIENWNRDAKPFAWTATPGEIIASVRILHRDVKKLFANNSK